MKVVNLKNKYTDCNLSMINVVGESVFYIEEKLVDQNKYLFFIKNNINLNSEEVVVYHKLENNFNYKISYDLIGENCNLYIWQKSQGLVVYKFNINNTKNVTSVSHGFFGDLNFVSTLNNNKCLVYLSSDSSDKVLFDYYFELLNSTSIVFLFDMQTNQTFLVKDERLFNCEKEDLKTFTLRDEEYLLVTRATINENMKQYIYNENRNEYVGNKYVEDTIWKAKLDNLVSQINIGKASYNFDKLLSSDINGYTRIVEVNGEWLYFRCKLFSTHVEEYCRLNLITGVIEKLSQVDNEEEGVVVYYGNFNSVYKIYKEDDLNVVESLLDSDKKYCISKKYGDVLDIVEDKYIITKINLKSNNQNTYLYLIYDAQQDREDTFRDDYKFFGDKLVLY